MKNRLLYVISHRLKINFPQLFFIELKREENAPMLNSIKSQFEYFERNFEVSVKGKV